MNKKKETLQKAGTKVKRKNECFDDVLLTMLSLAWASRQQSERCEVQSRHRFRRQASRMMVGDEAEGGKVDVEAFGFSAKDDAEVGCWHGVGVSYRGQA